MSLSPCGSGTMSSQQQGQNYQERMVLRGSWRMCAGCFFRTTFILVDNICSCILCFPAFLYTQRFNGVSLVGGRAVINQLNQHKTAQARDLDFWFSAFSVTLGAQQLDQRSKPWTSCLFTYDKNSNHTSFLFSNSFFFSGRFFS